MFEQLTLALKIFTVLNAGTQLGGRGGGGNASGTFRGGGAFGQKKE